jgi:hypothetical protein
MDGNSLFLYGLSLTNQCNTFSHIYQRGPKNKITLQQQLLAAVEM